MKKTGFITQVIALFSILPLLLVSHINMDVKGNRQQEYNIERETATTIATVFIAQFASVKESVTKAKQMRKMKQRKAYQKALRTCRLDEMDNIFDNSLFRNKTTNHLEIKMLCLEKGLIQKSMRSSIRNELMKPVAEHQANSKATNVNAYATNNNLPEKEWLIMPMLL